MISIRHILYFYIIVTILFSDVYIVVPWLRPLTIMNYMLVIVWFLYPRPLIDRKIYQLQQIVIIFILYMFAINFFQNDFQKTFSLLLSTWPIPFVLSIFSKYPKNDEMIFFYAKFYLLYNLIFSILQFSGISITSGEILSKIPFLGVDRTFVDFGAQGLRISGATSSTIGLACMLGFIFILFYYYRGGKLLSSVERKIYLAIILFLILLTQTRSLIFALPLVIMVTNMMVSKKRTKAISFTLLGTIIFVILVYLALPILMDTFPRLFLAADQDGSIVHRLQANVFGSVGTFYLSPLIGVPFSEALHAMEVGYEKVGLFIGNYFISEVTHHNQIAYYFRYYGFIGLALFILLYVKMFKVALSPHKTEINKKIVFAIILFHFLYTLSHNNKWTMDYYLWIFIALQLTDYSKKIKKGKRL